MHTSNDAQLMDGAFTEPDKIERGTAWSTNSHSKSWINLGDFSGECIVDPSQCTNRLALGLWLKPVERQSGFIFSSGAQASGACKVLIHHQLYTVVCCFVYIIVSPISVEDNLLFTQPVHTISCTHYVILSVGIWPETPTLLALDSNLGHLGESPTA